MTERQTHRPAGFRCAASSMANALAKPLLSTSSTSGTGDCQAAASSGKAQWRQGVCHREIKSFPKGPRSQMKRPGSMGTCGGM